ncbi:MAG: GDSL-type esterase/lipase family protein [Capsulimonadaceae bacterium]|nr:GDSL-type esterase/lipase family protein [Capsulimonadaceae bacterium]
MGIDTETQQSALQAAETNWEAEIRAFELADQQNPPPKGGIVFVGSSTLANWAEIAEDFAPLPVLNRGFGGSHIMDAVRYAERIVLPYEPRQVVVYSGENDIGNGRMPRDIFHDYHRLVDLIHASHPKTLVSYISIKHSPERWPLRDAIRVTNHLVAAYTKDHPGTSYIDTSSLTLDETGKPIAEFYTDGVHLSRSAYELWIPIVRAALVE